MLPTSSWLYRTAGDVLRNFGARELTGVRGAYERLIKVGYGLSILGTVPLVVLPFQDSLGPLIAPWLKPLTKNSDKKQDMDGSSATADRLLLQEHLVTTAVLGRCVVRSACSASTSCLHTLGCEATEPTFHATAIAAKHTA